MAPPSQTHHVEVRPGVHFEILVDPSAQDDISQAYFRDAGDQVAGDCVGLMLDLIRPGDAVLDLGAYVGTFALTACAAGCRVLAVDPSPKNVSLVRASAIANNFGALSVVEAAVSDAAGKIDFVESGPFGHVAPGAEPRWGASEGGVLCLRTDDLLDELGWDRVALVKMDVEGSEIRVLRGMQKLLRSQTPPFILFESNGYTLQFFGSQPADLYGELEDLGYEIYLVRQKKLVRIRSGDLQPETVVDCLAVKGERPSLPGWTWEKALTLQECLSSLAREARLESLEHRGYVARTLRDASPEVLAHPDAKKILKLLREDAPQLAEAADEPAIDEKPPSSAKASETRLVSFANNREDVLLNRLFENQDQGFYIDVGAGDPDIGSLTRLFYDRGWSGINVEPSSKSFSSLNSARSRDVNLNVGLSSQPGWTDFYEFTGDLWPFSTVSAEVAAAHAGTGIGFEHRKIQVTTLAEICREHVTGDIDLLSIDVEGHEQEVLLGADWEKWRPRVVVVEATKPGTSTPSHELWEHLLIDARYVCAAFDGLNRFYIREEDRHLAPKLNTPVNVLDNYVPYEFHRHSENLQNSLTDLHGHWLAARALTRDLIARLDLFLQVRKTPSPTNGSPLFRGSAINAGAGSGQSISDLSPAAITVARGLQNAASRFPLLAAGAKRLGRIALLVRRKIG